VSAELVRQFVDRLEEQGECDGPQLILALVEYQKRLEDDRDGGKLTEGERYTLAFVNALDADALDLSRFSSGAVAVLQERLPDVITAYDGMTEHIEELKRERPDRRAELDNLAVATDSLRGAFEATQTRVAVNLARRCSSSAHQRRPLVTTRPREHRARATGSRAPPSDDDDPDPDVGGGAQVPEASP
jgi:hypothetical protein